MKNTSQTNSKALLECVPNFSEGVNSEHIKQICEAIERSGGVRVLNVDPGEATNRTVVTFVGEPAAVCEAAFEGVKRASELIDMSTHKGEHPRIGATDVLPLVPISGITLEQAAELARGLAKRIYDELSIPTYCYESAALKSENRNLAHCRAGEYEGLERKMGTAQAPDFGGDKFTDQARRSGATCVGARDFLVAVNFNLNTTSTRRANAVAFDVREKGRTLDLGQWREGDNGLWVRVEGGKKSGETITLEGTMKGTKAIGWFIEEYGVAQVSMNITDINVAPLHLAFEAVCEAAAKRGLRVTGTEIVGLVPKRVLVEAGKYFLEKQERSIGVGDEELIRIASRTMGLDELSPFEPRERVIEYLLEDSSVKRLIDMSCKGFAVETASESPAPGGGSISAYMGALGAALGTMVANLSSHKAGWDSRWKEFSDYAQKGQELMGELLALVDEDTASFNAIMAAMQLPKSTDAEKTIRNQAMQDATVYATEVPLRTMQVAMEVMPLVRAMAQSGNPNSVSDAGVGALALRGAVLGAWLNVKINASGIKDRELADELLDKAAVMAAQVQETENEILEIVNQKID